MLLEQKAQNKWLSSEWIVTKGYFYIIYHGKIVFLTVLFMIDGFTKWLHGIKENEISQGHNC